MDGGKYGGTVCVCAAEAQRPCPAQRSGRACGKADAKFTWTGNCIGGRQMRDIGNYYNFNSSELSALYRFVAQKHYPHRIVPRKWPDTKLIGKAMARGWAVPCRYYPIARGLGKFVIPFVYPGITDSEMAAIHAIMRKEGAIWEKAKSS